ncbi:hypothetical protein CKM354_000581600 [Cercospora kikuchii]|uniref:Uncharacterized protein n=1 Tax=Cercospora kikuchii TaxID=84275 RepID=A0A9P3FH62_9PEZI|nr:uncharacterized protein CKM354_000581600 [Cercospora kikuchii]GIZ42554.1 hypothetical protein CKM354_000581600 [Cercospora kikuchii]
MSPMTAQRQMVSPMTAQEQMAHQRQFTQTNATLGAAADANYATTGCSTAGRGCSTTATEFQSSASGSAAICKQDNLEYNTQIGGLDLVPYFQNKKKFQSSDSGGTSDNEVFIGRPALPDAADAVAQRIRAQSQANNSDRQDPLNQQRPSQQYLGEQASTYAQLARQRPQEAITKPTLISRINNSTRSKTWLNKVTSATIHAALYYDADAAASDNNRALCEASTTCIYAAALRITKTQRSGLS